MVDLVRAGRMPEELAKEYGPTGQSIRNWVREASREENTSVDEMNTAEREKLKRLRKENRQLREERDILRKATIFFASMATWWCPAGFPRFFAALA
ncbi:transposase [Frankia sp. CiP3]|uniref:transposase n=1 Tax=Frankia sp. CiP3 TaxID=2880971 RepID=UPI001EF5492C|nr:transposase [Frankia sp. CiP3]